MSKKKQKILEKNPEWHLSRGERNSYYVGDMGRGTIMAVMTAFMATFLLFQGIDPLKVAGVTAVIKFIDAFDDVIFGFIIDSFDVTKWKWARKIAGDGKYLPWYRLTFFTFPIAIVAFFLMPRSLPDGGKLVWYAVTYLLYDLTCTLNEVPMNSLIMTLTDNVNERNNILKEKIIFSTIFALIIGFAMPFLISEYVGLPINGVAVGIAMIAFITMIPLATGVKEYNVGLKNVDTTEEHTYTFCDMIRCVKTNKYMAIYLIHSVIFITGTAGAVASLFVSFYLFKSSVILNLATLIALIPGFLMQAYSDKIINKFGRRNTYVGILLFQGAVQIVLYFIGYKHVGIVVVFAALGGVFNFLLAVIKTFLIPDTIEYTRYKTGEDCAGIFYALNSFVTKAMQGLVGALGLALLGWFGFKALNAASFADLEGGVQSSTAMWGMWFLYALFPAICTILSAIVMILYNLNDQDAELMAKCNSGEITKEECESQLSRKY